MPTPALAEDWNFDDYEDEGFIDRLFPHDAYECPLSNRVVEGRRSHTAPAPRLDEIDGDETSTMMLNGIRRKYAERI